MGRMRQQRWLEQEHRGEGKAGLESMDSRSPAGLALPQEKEMEKQRLLYQQARLHNRGAAEMVLQMISACKGAFHMHPAPPQHSSCLPVPHPTISCGPSGTLSHPCMPVVCTHTPVFACPTCLAISHILPSQSPLHTPPALLSHPWDDYPLVGRTLLPNRSHHLLIPPPPGETGAMVSSTLKLGISILNGGNADVQQVTGEGTREEG